MSGELVLHPVAPGITAPQEPGDVTRRRVFIVAEILGALVDLVAGEIAFHPLERVFAQVAPVFKVPCAGDADCGSAALELLAQFQTTLRFAQRYPARVVVLCPEFDEQAPAEIRAKIYGECFLGKSKNDMRCVEFVILHYTMGVRDYLESQVSVCLSTDMPLYYWAHRFSSAKRLADYAYLLTRSQRILFDSALVGAEAFSYPWPNLSAVRDLAYTRTLPLRQNLGQFLSRYTPAQINTGLQRVTIRHRREYGAEANCLLGWVRKGLEAGFTVLDHVTDASSPTFAAQVRVHAPAASRRPR